MSTFSEIVDDVASSTGQGSNISLVASFVNRAMKALTPINHFSDLVEERFCQKCPWHGKIIIDLPCNYRKMRVVRIDNHRYVKRKLPGLSQVLNKNPMFYYESGDKLVIKSSGQKHVDIAYYRTTPNFLYYSPERRLLRTANGEFNNDTGLEYRIPETDEWLVFNPHDPNHVKSRDKHVNWLTKNYPDVLLNGALSNAYNSGGETERGRTLFAQFRADVNMIKAAHDDMVAGEQ